MVDMVLNKMSKGWEKSEKKKTTQTLRTTTVTVTQLFTQRPRQANPELKS